MKRFVQAVWTRRWKHGGNSEDPDVFDAALEDVCVYPDSHVPEAGGTPAGEHGLYGYLAGAEVEE